MYQYTKGTLKTIVSVCIGMKKAPVGLFSYAAIFPIVGFILLVLQQLLSFLSFLLR